MVIEDADIVRVLGYGQGLLPCVVSSWLDSSRELEPTHLPKRPERLLPISGSSRRGTRICLVEEGAICYGSWMFMMSIRLRAKGIAE